MLCYAALCCAVLLCVYIVHRLTEVQENNRAIRASGIYPRVPRKETNKQATKRSKVLIGTRKKESGNLKSIIR